MAVIAGTHGTVTLAAGSSATRIFSNPAGTQGVPNILLSSVVPTNPAQLGQFTHHALDVSTVEVSGQDQYIGSNRFNITYSCDEDTEVEFIFVWTDWSLGLVGYNGV